MLQRYWINWVCETWVPYEKNQDAIPDNAWVKASEAEARIAALEARLEPCDVCHSIDCEESDKDYYIKRWKLAEAEVTRLRKALEFIASGIPTGNGYSHEYLAKKTLEAKQ
jgi:hypothetical protein